MHILRTQTTHISLAYQAVRCPRQRLASGQDRRRGLPGSQLNSSLQPVPLTQWASRVTKNSEVYLQGLTITMQDGHLITWPNEQPGHPPLSLGQSLSPTIASRQCTCHQVMTFVHRGHYRLPVSLQPWTEKVLSATTTHNSTS